MVEFGELGPLLVDDLGVLGPQLVCMCVCVATTCLVSALSFVRLFQLSEMRGVTVYIFDVVSVGDLPIAR